MEHVFDFYAAGAEDDETSAADADTYLVNFSIRVTSFLVKKEQRYLSTEFSRHVLGYLQQTLKFNWIHIAASTPLDAPAPGTANWTGVGALLMNGTADVAIDLNAFVPFRAKHFVLLHPLFSERISVYFRQPLASSVRNIFIQPFTPGLWLTLIGQLLLVWVILRCIKYAQSRKWAKDQLGDNDNGNDNDNHGKVPGSSSIEMEAHAYGFGTVLWLVSFVTVQGWYKRPRLIGLRIAALVGSYAGLVLSISYSATLVSLFALNVKPIGNLGQFTAATGVPLYASETSDTIRSVFREGFLRTTGFGASISSKAIQYVPQAQAYTLAVGNSTSATAPSAYLTFPYKFYTESRSHCHVTDKFLCDEITELEALRVPFLFGWVLSKSKQSVALLARQSFNTKIIVLYTSGLLWREKKAYTGLYRPACVSGSQPKSRALFTGGGGLTLADTFTGFLLLLVGILLSFVVVGAEKCKSNCIRVIRAQN